MGWFSRAKSWASSVCGSIKRSVSGAVDTVKKACSKVWNKFTGKHYTNEAEAILDEAREKYDKAKSDYEESIKLIGENIESKISHINTCKKEIYDIQFKRFISVSSRLHNVTVRGVPFEELFDDSILEVKTLNGVRKNSEIITIDFDRMGLIETAGMILTLGFFSRKKAKESLENAKQELTRVEEEIAKMAAQKKKLNVIVESIDNVVEYFDKLITSYSLLLDRFEFGIQSQRVKQMSHSDNIFSLKLDFKLMPIVHIEEFQSLFNLSIVLKQMASLGYLSADGEVVEKDIETSHQLVSKALDSKLCA